MLSVQTRGREIFGDDTYAFQFLADFRLATLSDEAFRVWVLTTAWSIHAERDGLILTSEAAGATADPSAARELEAVGLWVPFAGYCYIAEAWGLGAFRASNKQMAWARKRVNSLLQREKAISISAGFSQPASGSVV